MLSKHAPLKSSMAAESAAPPAASLRDLNIRTYRLSELAKDECPVIFIHSPRSAGASTLIGSLLVQLQQDWGLDGAFVLTDRADRYYMGGILPSGIILDKPFEFVLRKLIEVQCHRQSTFPDRPALKLAIAVDDFIYQSKDLKSAAVIRDIKLAKSYSIAIIIATPDATILPGSNGHTLATHVLATRCISTEEPKLLKKSLFVMFDSPVALADTLALCRKHEYLLGLLRVGTTTGSSTFLDYSRSYCPQLYVASSDMDSAGVEAVFDMDPELISHMTYALSVRSNMRAV